MKLLKYILFIILIAFFSVSKANQIPVDLAFKDIDKNYKYYSELQSLYDRGIIFPDKNGNFNPKSLLTRDEFVGIVSEISCSECIKPNVDFSLVQKFSNKNPFFDVPEDNKFYYCIADGVEKGKVTGYHQGTICQNGKGKNGEKPFCPENNIILEEALAIILRSGNILSISEAEKVRKDIEAGTNYPNILNISPKLNSGAVYSFYPDFKKAYEYNFIDFDKNGTEKKLKLWDFGNEINPKQFITKEDFLRISYIALKNNSCKPKSENNFGLKIDILDKICTVNQENCKLTDFPIGEKIFDLKGNISNFSKNGFIYNWRIYDYEKGTYENISGEFIDNYNFKKDGKYRVILNAENPKIGKSEVFTDIVLTNKITDNNQNNNLKINIFNEKCSENIAFCLDENFPNNNKIFDIKGSGGVSEYSWTIKDLDRNSIRNDSGDFLDNKNFPNNGTYEITLNSKDINGNNISTSKIITIGNNNIDNSDKNGLTSFIITDKIRAKRGENINFTGVTNKGKDVTYSWDFGDGKTGNGENQSHNYLVNGVYKVTLIATDKNGNKSISTVNIIISNNPGFEGTGKDSDGDGVPDEFDNEINTPKERIDYICKLEHISQKIYSCTEEDLGVYNPEIERNYDDKKDSDNDGVPDNIDLCKDIKGDKNNFGCPIFEKKCNIDSDCNNGEFCNSGYCKIKTYNLNCAYSGGNVIIGKAECNSCPCNVNLDFNASLRACDIVFPAITSPDQKDIFSKGSYFQIKKIEK